ncbi:MAG: hypothetical protein CM15mP74_26910 [Halieaceae bacterium]|nr:MAG: hypothetical protein CM15mP74_26910 [Halieaceae bacterium]
MTPFGAQNPRYQMSLSEPSPQVGTFAVSISSCPPGSCGAPPGSPNVGSPNIGKFGGHRQLKLPQGAPSCQKTLKMPFSPGGPNRRFRGKGVVADPAQLPTCDAATPPGAGNRANNGDPGAEIGMRPLLKTRPADTTATSSSLAMVSTSPYREVASMESAAAPDNDVVEQDVSKRFRIAEQGGDGVFPNAAKASSVGAKTVNVAASSASVPTRSAA